MKKLKPGFGKKFYEDYWDLALNQFFRHTGIFVYKAKNKMLFQIIASAENNSLVPEFSIETLEKVVKKLKDLDKALKPMREVDKKHKIK